MLKNILKKFKSFYRILYALFGRCYYYVIDLTAKKEFKEETVSNKIWLDPEAIRKLKADINLIEKGLIRKEDMRKAKEMRELREEIDNMKTLCIVSEIGIVPEVKTKRAA